MSDDHPSALIQDRWLLGIEVSPAERAHLESCPACTARAERLRAPTAVPAWARALGDQPAARRPVRTWAVAGGLAALAAAAMIALFFFRPPTPETTTVRGAPAVGVYVRHGARVSLWDGRQPIEPGDRIRLKVVAEGFRHVTVLVPERAGSSHLRVLHDAPVDPARETLLEPAWRVDEAPGDETLVVVLADRVVAPEEVGRRSRDRWVRWLRLPKRGGGDR